MHNLHPTVKTGVCCTRRCIRTKAQALLVPSRAASSSALASSGYSNTFISQTNALHQAQPKAGSSNLSTSHNPHPVAGYPEPTLGVVDTKRIPIYRNALCLRPKLEKNWTASLELFDQTAERRELRSIPTPRLAKLVHTFAACAEVESNPLLTSPPVIPSQFGRRMKAALDELKTRPDAQHQLSPFRILCWSIEANANCGDPSHISMLPQLPHPTSIQSPFTTKQLHRDTYVALRTIRRVMRMNQLLKNPARTNFTILHDQWPFLQPLLMTSPDNFPYKVNREVDSLKPIAIQAASSFATFSAALHAPAFDKSMLSFVLVAQCVLQDAPKALRTYQALVKHGIEVTHTHFTLLMRELIKDGLLDDAIALMKDREQLFRLESPHAAYHEAALALFARQGLLAQAQERFKKLGSVGSCTYHVRHLTWLIQAAASTGNAEEAGRLFRSFFAVEGWRGSHYRATIEHYTLVIEAHAHNGDHDSIATWIDYMRQNGLHPDSVVFNTILQIFAKKDNLSSIHRYLKLMENSGVRKTEKTYTILISFFGKRNDPGAAEKMARQAVEEGIEPDAKLTYALLDAHVQARSWDAVIRVFDYLESRHLPPTRYSTASFNHVLKAYVKVGASANTVMNAFSKMKRYGLAPSIHTYSYVIRSVTDAGKMAEAMSVLEEMDHLSIAGGPAADTPILTTIMSGYLRIGARNKAKEIFDDLKTRGLKPDATCFGLILKAYADERTDESLQIAESFLKDIVESLPSHDPLIHDTSNLRDQVHRLFMPLMIARALKGDADAVQRYLQSVLDLGGKLTVPLLSVLLDAHRHQADITSAKLVWAHIFRIAKNETEHRIVDEITATTSATRQHRHPNLLSVPLSIFIDSLSTQGLHDEIAVVWHAVREAGFSFDASNWNHLALALIRAGQPERAFQVVEHIIIPYRHQHQQLTPTRSLHLNNMFSSITNNSDDTALDPIVGCSSRRHQSVRFGGLVERQGNYRRVWRLTDPALPIQLLRQSPPVTNFWRAHAATLNALHNVLLRLDEGDLLLPLSPTIHQQSAIENNPPEAERLLKIIMSKYPYTCQLVLRKKARYHKRRVRSLRKDPHGWLIGVKFGPQPQWSRARELQRNTMRRARKLERRRFRRKLSTSAV